MFDLCGIEKLTIPVAAKSAFDFVGPVLDILDARAALQPTAQPLYTHTRPRVQQAPGIPCALFSLRDKIHANLGRKCAARPQRHIQSSSPAKAHRR